MDNCLTAVIADDEPLLREALQRELAELWPELSIVATVTNGSAAIEKIMQYQPDIAFLDIKMPGASGLEVAETIADEWPDGIYNQPPPLIVFVTAYDDYAVEAFDAAAIDYVLKPLNQDRLKITITRLLQRLQPSDSKDPGLHRIQQLSNHISNLLSHSQAETENVNKLSIIRASVGDMVRMIPVDEIILFESADKYVSVYTKTHEALIRESLRSLLPQLDNRFARIHRGAIVNMTKVDAAIKHDTGKLTLRLLGIEREPVVSRVYRHLFQAM